MAGTQRNVMACVGRLCYSLSFSSLLHARHAATQGHHDHQLRSQLSPPNRQQSDTLGESEPAPEDDASEEPAPGVDTTPVGLEDLPPALRAEVVELVQLTQELRELEFLEAPVITVVDDVELAERVRESIEEEADGLDEDVALFELLGLVPEGTDLLALYTDLYGEQVAGYYDGDEGELVIPSNDSLSSLQKATLVHELTHALTDQHFAMSETFDTLIDEERFDEATAFLSVIEGDATLTEVLYIQDLPLSEQQALISESLEADSTAFDNTPSFISDSLLFPYSDGFNFVQRLYQLGGFGEIGRAYVKPPVSSEQIIEPRDFGRDLPIDVAAPIRDIEGYELIEDSVWGELGFQTMLAQILGTDRAKTAADGWGGDRYAYFFGDGEAALIIEYRGDSEADAIEMQEILIEYVTQAMDVGASETVGGAQTFTGEDFAAVNRQEDSVRFVATSDPVLGPTLLQR